MTPGGVREVEIGCRTRIYWYYGGFRHYNRSLFMSGSGKAKSKLTVEPTKAAQWEGKRFNRSLNARYTFGLEQDSLASYLEHELEEHSRHAGTETERKGTREAHQCIRTTLGCAGATAFNIARHQLSQRGASLAAAKSPGSTDSWGRQRGGGFLP